MATVNYDTSVFIRIEFNLVVIVMIAVVTRRKGRPSSIQWFMDILTASTILYGTIHRSLKLLQNPDWAMNGNQDDIKNFLIHSVAAWIASAIFEFRSCIDFMQLITQIWPRKQLSRKSRFFLYGMLAVFGCVSSYLMSQYSTCVWTSAKMFTQERNVYIYFYAAAIAKNLRILVQWLCHFKCVTQSPERAMTKKIHRLTFSNIVMTIQAIFLTGFVKSRNHWDNNTKILFTVDTIYRIIQCIWLWYLPYIIDEFFSRCFQETEQGRKKRASRVCPTPPERHLNDLPYWYCEETAKGGEGEINYIYLKPHERYLNENLTDYVYPQWERRRPDSKILIFVYLEWKSKLRRQSSGAMEADYYIDANEKMAIRPFLNQFPYEPP